MVTFDLLDANDDPVSHLTIDENQKFSIDVSIDMSDTDPVTTFVGGSGNNYEYVFYLSTEPDVVQYEVGMYIVLWYNV